MLRFRASRRAGRVAGLLGVGAAVLTCTTVVRVQRVRRTAGQHAHDLDTDGVVGEGLGDRVRLVVLGDSAARGFGLPDAASAFPQQVARRVAAATGRRVEVRSSATDGHRTADVLADQVPLLAAARPDAVVVSVGVNDVVRRTGRDDLWDATVELLAAVEAAADGAVVVFVTCPDLGAAPGFGRALGALVGWRCRRVAAVQAAAARSVGTPTVELPRPDATMFGVDGFHPGVTGHAVMAELTTDALLRVADDVRKDLAWTSD